MEEQCECSCHYLKIKEGNESEKIEEKEHSILQKIYKKYKSWSCNRNNYYNNSDFI